MLGGKDKCCSDLSRMIKAQLVKYDDNPFTYLPTYLPMLWSLAYALNVNT